MNIKEAFAIQVARNLAHLENIVEPVDKAETCHTHYQVEQALEQESRLPKIVELNTGRGPFISTRKLVGQSLAALYSLTQQNSTTPTLELRVPKDLVDDGDLVVHSSPVHFKCVNADRERQLVRSIGREIHPNLLRYVVSTELPDEFDYDDWIPEGHKIEVGERKMNRLVRSARIYSPRQGKWLIGCEARPFDRPTEQGMAGVFHSYPLSLVRAPIVEEDVVRHEQVAILKGGSSSRKKGTRLELGTLRPVEEGFPGL